MLLCHCASFKPGLGFQEVKALVAKRTDKEIRWTAEVTADSVSADVEGAVVRKRLTLDEAIQQALFRSPALQAIYETLGVAQADMLVSRWPRNPILDAEARVGSGTLDVEFSLLQNLLDIFYLPLRRRLSAAEFEAAKFKVASSVLELIARVRVAYYDLQAAIARREFMQIVAAARDASFDLARRLHEAGNLTDLEFANEEALYRLAEINLNRMTLGASTARQTLALLTGQTDLQSGEVIDELPTLPSTEPSVVDLEKDAVEKNLALAAKRQAIEALKARAGISRLAPLDDAEIGGAFSKEKGDWTSGPSVSIPVPSFTLGQGARGRAESELRQAQQQLIALQIDLQVGVRIAQARLTTARANVTRYRDQLLPLRRKIVDEVQKSYNAMLVGGFELLRARETEATTAIELINELLEYWRARSDIEQLQSGGWSRTREENDNGAAIDVGGTRKEVH